MYLLGQCSALPTYLTKSCFRRIFLFLIKVLASKISENKIIEVRKMCYILLHNDALIPALEIQCNCFVYNTGFFPYLKAKV